LNQIELCLQKLVNIQNTRCMLVAVEVFYPCDSSRSYRRQALNGQPDTVQGAASNGPARPMTPQGTAWQGMVAWFKRIAQVLLPQQDLKFVVALVAATSHWV